MRGVSRPTLARSVLAVAAAAERARLRGSLHEFVRAAWRVVETDPYVDGWHVEEICAHLEALADRRIRNLAIAIPPGFSKSLLCCVFWPAWVWLKNPGARFMFASVDLALARRDALRTRELLDSPWFRARFGHLVQIDRSGRRADSALEYYTTAGGLRFTTSVGSKAVGWHVDYQVVDDPLKPLEASPSTCGEARDWWEGTMASRRRSAATFCRLIVQQRVHRFDLIALAIEKSYECLILPLTHDPGRHELPAGDPRALRRTSVGGDRRTRPGELLCPSRVGPGDLAGVRAEVGAHYGVQYEQDPRSESDRVLTRSALAGRWRALPPGGFYSWSWDLRFSRAEDSGSWVVGQLWYRQGVEAYLVEERRGRWGYAQSEAEVLRAARDQPGSVLVENKANGPAVEDALRTLVPGIVLVNPRGGKLVRAHAVSQYLPHVRLPSAWDGLDAWLSEVEQFPAEPNDRGDCMTQFLAWSYLPEQGRAGGQYASKIRGLAGR